METEIQMVPANANEPAESWAWDGSSLCTTAVLLSPNTQTHFCSALLEASSGQIIDYF